MKTNTPWFLGSHGWLTDWADWVAGLGWLDEDRRQPQPTEISHTSKYWFYVYFTLFIGFSFVFTVLSVQSNSVTISPIKILVVLCLLNLWFPLCFLLFFTK